MGKKSKKKQIRITEEEIDLGKLFSMIGGMFSTFFNFIKNILKGLFHYLVVLLIFIKDYVKYVLIATFIGAVLGFSMDYFSSPNYTYDMIIEPNYKSIDQVFEKMEYYNVLIANRDSITISKEFDISYNDANSLTSFELTSYETKKDQILAYDAFIKKTDTTTQKIFSYSDFIGEGTSKFDSKRYIYRINSSNSHLKLFGPQILKDIESNPTIKKRRRIKMNTLKLDSIAARISLKEIDSLRSLYKKVTLLEVSKKATPNGSSTYLDFSKEAQSNNNDIALFEISKELNTKLVEIESEKETSEDIINVITTFNSAGKQTGTFYETKMFLFGRLFGSLVLLLILLGKLNTYLINYKKQII